MCFPILSDTKFYVLGTGTPNPNPERAGSAYLLIVNDEPYLFDFGAKIFFGDTGLEENDKKGELAGIGGEYWEKYKVPDDVEYGFVIVPPGEGDMPTE